MGLFKPTIVSYRLNGSTRTESGERVNKDTPGAQRIKEKARNWYGRYRDSDGKVRTVPLCENKEAARQLLAKLVIDAKMNRAGLADPFDAQRKRSLSAHLDEFKAALQARNNTDKHAGITFKRAKSVLDGCKFKFFGDVQASRVAGWLAEERKAGRLSITTGNYYLRDTKSFFTWMMKDARSPHNPLIHLPYLNAATDSHRERRTLAAWEFEALLNAARTGKKVRALAGANRFMLYLVASETGFRAQELASLTPASFRLDGAAPTATVGAAYSKHKREDVQPIRPELATLLREWIGTKLADEQLWPGKWWRHAAKMIRADLAAARSAWIEAAGADVAERKRREQSTSLEFADADGRVFDFHSLRGQFVSALEAAGVSPKMLQTLARHSDIKTTLKHYARVQVSDTQAALDKLPKFPTARVHEPAALRATGTDPAPCALHAPCTSFAQTADSGCERLNTDDNDMAIRAVAVTALPLGDLIAPGSENERVILRGPSRIRTGDGGFAIHCLTTWLRGRSRATVVGILSALSATNKRRTRQSPRPRRWRISRRTRSA